MLPLVLTVPSAGSFFHLGVTAGAPKRQNRAYEVILIVEPWNQNNQPENMELTTIVWQNLMEAILDPENIAVANIDTNTPSVQPYQVTIMDSEGNPHSDGGLVGDIEVGGMPHWGVRLRVNVREWWQ